MNADQLYDEVIMKLIGKINPIGSSEVDAERLENLKTAAIICERFIRDIAEVSKNKGRFESSIDTAGVTAFNAIREFHGQIEDTFN